MERRGTAYAALVLLSLGPATGYELKQRADRTLRFFFNAPAMSQIYSELDRLAADGLVGRAGKQFELLPTGREELTRWLAEGELTPTVFKSHLALRLMVGYLTEPERLLADVDAELERLGDDLVAVDAVRDSLPPDDEQLGWAWMVANWGDRYFRDQIEQLAELRTLIEKRVR